MILGIKRILMIFVFLHMECMKIGWKIIRSMMRKMKQKRKKRMIFTCFVFVSVGSKLNNKNKKYR
jgi:hypothetical protein